MKKIIFTILLIFLIIPITFLAEEKLKINSNSIQKFTDGFITRFYDEAILTNDAGSTSPQRINVVKTNLKDSNYMVATWQAKNNKTPLLRTVYEHSMDFEKNNPNYQVIAAINADYFFETKYTVNSLRDFQGNLINSNNHTKYDSLVFDNKLDKYKIVDNLNYSDNFLVTLRDAKTNQIIEIIQNVKLNSKSVKNKVSFHYNYFLKDFDGKYLEFENIFFNNTNNKTYFLGNKPKLKTGDIVNNSKFQLVLTEKLEEIFTKNNNIIIQVSQTSIDFMPNDMITGFDNQIIKDKIIPTFDKLKGQSDSNNKSRHPRTGVGFDENNNLYFFTVDGRQTNSKGVNLREFGKIMYHYGVNNGFNLDGGGSTQFYFRNFLTNKLEVVNKPSEGSSDTTYRRVGNVLLVIKPKIKSNFTYKEENNKINFNYELKNGEKIKLLINNQEKPMTNDLNITEDIKKISVLINDKLVFDKIYNTKFNLNKPKIDPKILNSEFVADKNKLLVKVFYEDEDNLITSIKIINKKLNKSKTFLNYQVGVKNLELDNTYFENGDNIFTIRIEYSYNNFIEKEYTYNYKNQKEEEIIPPTKNNKVLFISIFSVLGTVVLLSGTIVIVILVKKKRKSK